MTVVVSCCLFLLRLSMLMCLERVPFLLCMRNGGLDLEEPDEGGGDSSGGGGGGAAAAAVGAGGRARFFASRV